MARITSEMLDGAFIDNIALAVGTESANVVTVTLTVDQQSKIPNRINPLVGYIATAADGLILEVPSGGVAAGASGTVTALTTDGSIFTVVPDDGGVAEIDVTEATVDTLYLILVNPDTGAKVASAALSYT